MTLQHKISDWSIAHNPKWLAFFRVSLGLSLLLKGFSFFNHALQFHDLMVNSFHIDQSWVDYAVIWINIAAGFLIVIGVFTRIACIVQIPIILGAIIFVHVPDGIFAFQSGLMFSILVLLLLVVFFIEGDGPVSFMNYYDTEVANKPK
ncbi:MAG TPA: DoxX family protein [Ferruginibacter sp.]|nr:DoxX family protein [Ferruginibacter sp.]